MGEITNVLSLFDGLSCGQIALKELGIIPDKYYASEIDKHAIAQTQLNFPNTIQLGSVLKVNTKTLCLSELYLYICKKYRERAKNSVIRLPLHIFAQAHGQYIEEMRKRGLINNQLELF